MSRHSSGPPGPRGGLRAGASITREWRWERVRDTLQSAAVRCKRDQYYLARGTGGERRTKRTEVAIRFLRDGHELAQRTVILHARNGHAGEVLGWLQTPETATHLQIFLTGGAASDRLADITLHAVAERDPKCHPLANVPRWSTYQPPFAIERVLVPQSLAGLAAVVPELTVSPSRPRSREDLATQARGGACILDPAWVDELELKWEHVLRLASYCWLVVDLETAGKLLGRAGLRGLELFTDRSEHGIMSARVEYADVQTRGFALQDVFPYCGLSPSGAFQTRALRANRAWRRFADELSVATLLASESPAESRTGHVLSAAAPLGRGELMVTDLPWLVAGSTGALVGPRLARHALRMHLAAPLADDLQYWNRWDDCQILVRDICDLARRYPPLQAVRWAPSADELEQLGIVLPAHAGTGPVRTVLIRTGRIDNRDPHDGLPPEPMMITMKQLAREAREKTAWAQRNLANVNVVWQFDTAAGQRYAVNYPSAEGLALGAIRSFRLFASDPYAPALCQPADSAWEGEQALVMKGDEGIFGDGSLDWLKVLTPRIRGWVEEESR